MGGIVYNFLTGAEKVKQITPEIKKQIEDLVGCMFDSGKAIEDFAKKYNIADESVLSFMADMQKSGTVYQTSEEALVAYEAHLKTVGKTVDWAAAKNKLLSASLKVLSTVGWMVVATIATEIISYSIKGLDYLANSVKYAKEAMEESVEAYETAKSELENINTELETQQKALDELQAKDKLTYAEKGQLEELKAITAELLIQQDIAEKEAARTQKDSAKKAAKTYEKQFGKFGESRETTENVIKYVQTTGTALDTREDSISGNIANLLYYTDVFKQTEDQLINEADSLTEKELKSLQKQYQSYVDQLDVAKTKLETQISDLEEQRQNMSSEYERIMSLGEDAVLSSNDKEIVTAYEEIVSLIQLIYQYIDPNKWNQMQVSNIFNTEGIEKTKDELVNMAEEGKLTPEILEGYPILNQAVKESSILFEEGTSKAESFCDELNAIADEQDKIQDSTLNDEDTNLFTNLLNSKDALEDFVSAVESASDAYSTLMNPNVSTSDMLSSILSITEAVSEMGGDLNWEFIESSDNSLKLLGDTIDYVSEKYTKSALVNAGIGEGFAEV